MVATPEAAAAGRKASQRRADATAIALAPVIADIKASGITTPYTIAAELVRRGIPTARGHRYWGHGQAYKLLKRLDRLDGLNAALAR
jgi:hypothetical protein